MYKFILSVFCLFIASMGNASMAISPPTGLMGVVGATGSVPYYNGLTWVTGATGITYDGTNATFSDTLTASKGISVSTIVVTGNSAYPGIIARAGGNAYTNVGIDLQNYNGTSHTYLSTIEGVFYLSRNGTSDHLTIAADGLFTFGGGIQHYARTKAEILAIDPVAAGEEYYCSNCATSTLCISTGTAVADFADIGDRTAACN